MSNTLSILKETVDTLGRDVYELRQTQEQVSTQMQQKGQADPLLEQKMDRLNQAIDEAQGRLDRLETASKRPQMGSMQDSHISTGDLSHKKAFMDYVRKGAEQELMAFESKSLSGGTDKDGGYFIPHVLSREIHKLLNEHCFMRDISRVTTVSHGSLELLVSKTNATVGWATETGDREDTAEPEIAKVVIPIHELYAKPSITQRLLEDSAVNLESWLMEKVASAMALQENKAFIDGDGDGKPKGFLAYDAIADAEWAWGKLGSVKTGTNGGLGKNAEASLLQLFHSLKPVYLPGACWVMSRTAQAQIRGLKDSKSGRYFWQYPSLAEPRPTLLGYPVYTSDDMPSMVDGTASKPIAFGNFKEGYQIVDRQGIFTLRDPYSAKPYVEFYTVKRVGGDVVNFEAIKILHCAQ